MRKIFPIEELGVLLKTQELVHKVYPTKSIKISIEILSLPKDTIIAFFEYENPNMLFIFAQQYEFLKHYSSLK
ncbi:MAG: hypothetical protein N4A35_03055 [Flavobacteriales bacterium]|jgi:hypothetical protein|nr:hypothetical protein [Flavobacteriales bacterium]